MTAPAWSWRAFGTFCLTVAWGFTLLGALVGCIALARRLWGGP